MDRQAIDVHGRIAFSNANRALPKTGQKRRWRRVRFCTFATCQLHRAMSAFRGNPEDICSDRVLPTLTPIRTPDDRLSHAIQINPSRNSSRQNLPTLFITFL
jgi:hypothetical protein